MRRWFHLEGARWRFLQRVSMPLDRCAHHDAAGQCGGDEISSSSLVDQPLVDQPLVDQPLQCPSSQRC